MTSLRTYGIGVVCLLAGIVLGFFLKGCEPSSPATEPIVIHDTIKVQDSAWLAAHTKHDPKPIRHDTIWLEREDSAENAHTTTDSNHCVDTTEMGTNADFAIIPITRSEYRDTIATDTSRVEVGVLFSGYNARIDSIGINYQVTAQPLVYEKESGWGWNYTFGFYAGYGATLVNGQIVLAPEIGFGVSIGIGYQRKFKRRKIINYSPNEFIEKSARLINKKSKDEITDNETNKL